MIDRNFPQDKYIRYFSTTHYIKRLVNGEKHERKWLIYSKDLDNFFVFVVNYLAQLLLFVIVSSWR